MIEFTPYISAKCGLWTSATHCPPPPGLFLEADVSQWAAVSAVNYLGVVHALKAGLPAMVARHAGRVLVVNSTGGFMGAPPAHIPMLPP